MADSYEMNGEISTLWEPGFWFYTHSRETLHALRRQRYRGMEMAPSQSSSQSHRTPLVLLGAIGLTTHVGISKNCAGKGKGPRHTIRGL